MKFEAVRAREHYAAAVAALHPEDKRALIAAEIMRATYEKLLGRMEADGFRVFQSRYRLAKWEKLWILAIGCLKSRFPSFYLVCYRIDQGLIQTVSKSFT